jgi:uncharacterized protein (TIGR00730 family)
MGSEPVMPIPPKPAVGIRSDVQTTRAITVFCSSASNVDRIYLDAADALGRAIADRGWTLVYGGNFVGSMAAVAGGARSEGGRVVGITPQFFIDRGVADHNCDELVVTADMRERKFHLEDRADAFIALPGGLGTMEELFEIIVGRQLKLHVKPIVLMNIAGFYDPLVALIEHGISGNFISPAGRDLFFVADNVRSAMNHLANALGSTPARPILQAQPADKTD